jgi:2-polyprenyl-3-methyl-5-hydroxy-6-metoxy-1,4-benzoquinol methylase
METPVEFKCRLCGGRNGHHIDTKDAKNNEVLSITACKGCGLVQQTSLPSDEDLKIYYSHNYRADYKKSYEPKIKHIHRAGVAAKDRIQFLSTHVSPDFNTSLLDIGAGGGEFVYLASKAGFNSRGIEPNEGYSYFSKKEYQIDIRTQMLDDLEPESANVITLFHVYEHMAHPFTVMEKISRTLKKGGYLFIEVPNILQNDASPHNIFFKAHLFYFSRYTIASFASQYFNVVKLEDKGNLKVLLQKREFMEENVLYPGDDEVSHTFKRLKEKGWLEYIFVGGGIFKPIRKIKKTIKELSLPNVAPREILDSI